MFHWDSSPRLYSSLFSLASPCVSIISWLNCLSRHNLLPQGIPSLYRPVCGLFHSLVSYPPTTSPLLGSTASASDLSLLACVCICAYMQYVLQVCQHPNSRMREWGAEALTALIKAGLAYKHDPPLAQNQVGQSISSTVWLKNEQKWRSLYKSTPGKQLWGKHVDCIAK